MALCLYLLSAVSKECNIFDKAGQTTPGFNNQCNQKYFGAPRNFWLITTFLNSLD